jgi:hypothetical protein
MQSFNDLPTATLAVYQQECCSAAQDLLSDGTGTLLRAAWPPFSPK